MEHDEAFRDRQSRSRARSVILNPRRERRLKTPERNADRPSRLDQEVRGDQRRQRTRSRSPLRKLREQEEELESQKQRVAVLLSQLQNERARRGENVRREPSTAGFDTHQERSRYDSASIFFDELLKMMKNRPGERESFTTINNVIPEFDPLSKEQTISVWVDKVDECAEIYDWTDRQIVHYALPKLVGQAKLWYQGLPSLKRTWAEWRTLLKESFPSNENYAELLNEMLSKRARFGESLEVYYYTKINLLNRCKIFGKNAVDCIVHGVDDRNVRIGAQAAKFEKPENVLEFFKTLRYNNDRKDKRNPTINQSSNTKSNDQTSTSKPFQSSPQLTCFNCKQKGHPSYKCPKPLIKCTYCNLMGHMETDCRKKKASPSDTKGKTILKVLMDSSSNIGLNLPNNINKDVREIVKTVNTSEKYKLPIRINNYFILSYLDLGSEATLIRKSDAEKLNLDWLPVNSPYLRGLGNVPYLPIGVTYINIGAQEVVESNVETYVVDDHLINCPVLLGHSFSERPNLRITKTATEVLIESVQADDIVKVPLLAAGDIIIPIGTFTSICVKSAELDCGKIYIPGTVRGGPNSEYYLLPGEYELRQGACNILVHGLGEKPVTLPKDSLITRARYLSSEVKVNLTVKGDYDPKFTINCNKNLSLEEQTNLEQLLTKYKTCFSWGMHDLGYTTETEMVIHLKDTEPVVYRPYRLSFHERELVKGMVHEMLENKIVRESCSPYASPIVLVQKKSGDKRLCVDYRSLNSKTKRDHYPLPRIDDLLDQLSGQSIFTTLDLASGYHQIPIAEESKEKTAFVTPDGQYEYNRMPFGLANAPAVFQRLIHKVLNNAHIKHSIVYMDDILIPSRTIAEGMSRLEEVLIALRQSGLTLKLEKCHFFKENIDFLGFEVSNGGIRPGSEKTLAVADFKTPTNQHEVRRFLGLASFFRRFVKDFATKARPLTNLLKKQAAWRWTDDETKAFETLKRNLIQRPVLALYDYTAETQLHTDASKMGLAGILLQRKGSMPFRPVAYFSRQTTADEQKYHSFELETLAVISSLNKFRVYLLGIKFTIITDCHALRSTFTKRDLVPRISRWWIQFLEFDCSIEYRAGAKMSHVDCLSRNPISDIDNETHILDVLLVNSEDWITTVQLGDPEIRRIKDTLEDPETAKVASIHKEYKVKNGKVFKILEDKTERWVVPRGVRWQLLKSNHDDVGHFGFDKTLDRIRSFFWFPKMRRFVKKYVSSCLACAHHKLPSGAKEGMLHPIPKVEIPLHTIHADHLGPFVRSKKKNSYILVIIDSFTKYVNLTPVRSTKTKASIKVFRAFFNLFGVPTRLITDRGTSFTSKKFKIFIMSKGIKHILNSVSTPRANGQVERYNRTILSALGAMTHDKNPESWDEYVQEVQLGINTTVHRVTKMTPTELLFGRKTTGPSQGILNEISDELGSGVIDSSLDDARLEASQAMRKHQEISKERFDRSRKPATVHKVGDFVRIIRALPSGSGQSKKLEPKCQGPYRIIKILPHDRFVVEDTPLTRKGRRYEGVVAIDKIFPWLTYGANYSSSSESDCNDKN